MENHSARLEETLEILENRENEQGMFGFFGAPLRSCVFHIGVPGVRGRFSQKYSSDVCAIIPLARREIMRGTG